WGTERNCCGNLICIVDPGANSRLNSFSQLRLKYSVQTSLLTSSLRISSETHEVLAKLFVAIYKPFARAMSRLFPSAKNLRTSPLATARSLSSPGGDAFPPSSVGGGGACRVLAGGFEETN